MSNLNPAKKREITNRLQKYTWEELDWLEKTVRSLKGDAPGIRFHRGNSPEGVAALHSFFANAADQHGGYGDGPSDPDYDPFAHYEP